MTEIRGKNYINIRDLLSIALFNILGTHYSIYIYIYIYTCSINIDECYLIAVIFLMFLFLQIWQWISYTVSVVAVVEEYTLGVLVVTAIGR